MSCIINLNTSFGEESSGAVGFTLTGLSDEEVVPNSLLWSMTDVDGVIINLREEIAATPASTTWIVLQGDDLQLTEASNVRILTVQGTYNSTIGGVEQTNLPYTGEFQFDICRFLNIPSPA